jgi:Flp pilus assembly protein TadG
MIEKLIDPLRWRASDPERGSMAIEFAIAAPVLITLFLGAADYGTLMNSTASLRGAARAGTEYAKANWNNPAVTNATTSTEQQVCSFLALAFDTGTNTCSPVTPSVSTSCTCSDDLSVTCPTPGSGSTPCPVTAGQTDTRVFQFVSVTATRSFSPIFSWTGFAFPSTVTAASVVRTQ